MGPKRRIWLQLTFASLSSTLIWNAKLVWKVAFSRIFRNSKILHLACHNLSQWDVRKNLLPIQAVNILLPMILNTDLPSRTILTPYCTLHFKCLVCFGHHQSGILHYILLLYSHCRDNDGVSLDVGIKSEYFVSLCILSITVTI